MYQISYTYIRLLLELPCCQSNLQFSGYVWYDWYGILTIVLTFGIVAVALQLLYRICIFYLAFIIMIIDTIINIIISHLVISIISLTDPSSIAADVWSCSLGAVGSESGSPQLLHWSRILTLPMGTQQDISYWFTDLDWTMRWHNGVSWTEGRKNFFNYNYNYNWKCVFCNGDFVRQ